MATQQGDDGTKNVTGSRIQARSLVSDLEFLTARARALGTRHANEKLEPLGLKVRSYAVLALACDDEQPSQRELAEFLTLDASQIVSLVDDLEQRGLVAREVDPRDRRSNVIVSTAKGRELFAKAQQATAAAQDESLRALSAPERHELKRLLTLIAFDE